MEKLATHHNAHANRDSNVSSGNAASKTVQAPGMPPNGLSRCIGNHLLQNSLLQSAQTKLRISQPNDKYELRADHIAEYPMRTPASALPPETPSAGHPHPASDRFDFNSTNRNQGASARFATATGSFGGNLTRGLLHGNTSFRPHGYRALISYCPLLTDDNGHLKNRIIRSFAQYLTGSIR